MYHRNLFIFIKIVHAFYLPIYFIYPNILITHAFYLPKYFLYPHFIEYYLLCGVEYAKNS